jgi:hypothetical protein
VAYTRGQSPQPSTTVLTVEQARHRNAELRIELVGLTREGADLEASTGLMREAVTAARKKLTRQIRDLDAIRAQSDRIAADTKHEPVLPAPQYGGREGLEAAAAEIEAYEGDKLGTVRRKGPRHGTSRKYKLGCRCDYCLGWRAKRSAVEVARQQRIRDEHQALKAAAAVAA